MALAVNLANSPAPAQTGGPEVAGVRASGAIVNKDDFLLLLVAQIKNQNPLNPADGVEFLAQLAQFSQLEQLINIRTQLDAFLAGVEAQAGETELAGDSPSGPAA
jgi:flagellar basal-body rod modification protein FlgD